MKCFLKHKFINVSVFVLGAYLLECLSLSFMGMGFFPTYFYLDLLILILLGSPIFFFKGSLFDKIYYPILLVVLTTINLLNVNFYLDTGNIFSLQNLYMIKSVDSVMFEHVKWYTLIIEVIIMTILITFIIFFNIKFKYSKKFKRVDVNVFLVMGMAFLSLSYPVNLYLTSNLEEDINNNITINYPTYACNYNFRKLGMLTYYIKEAVFFK